MNATRPQYQISVDGIDSTPDLTKYVASLTYTDRVRGQSDEVELVLNNSDGRFTGEWRFTKGSKLDVSIGYDGDLVACGTFTVDQIEASFGPDVVTVRALAAGTNAPVRTRKTVAHENKTIREIAQAVADAHGYTIDDGTSFSHREFKDWKTERAELEAAAAAIRSVLALFASPSAPLGWAAAINAALSHYAPLLAASDSLTAKGRPQDGTYIRQEVATWYAAWNARYYPGAKEARGIASAFAARLSAIAAQLVSVDKTTTRSKLDITVAWHTQDNETDLQYLSRLAGLHGILFSLRGTVMTFTSMYDVEAAEPLATYTRAEVTSARFTDNTVKSYKAAKVVWHDPDKGEATTSDKDGGASADTLVVHERAETQAQADEIAKAALHDSATREFEGEISIVGTPLAVAGVNVTLSGFGYFDGKWAVTESRHSISVDAGYSTSLTIKRGRAQG